MRAALGDSVRAAMWFDGADPVGRAFVDRPAREARDDRGCLYLLEFDNGLFKCGQSVHVVTRVTSNARPLFVADVRLHRVWASDWLYDLDRHEAELIAWADAHGERAAGGREWFRGLDFTAAIAAAAGRRSGIQLGGSAPAVNRNADGELDLSAYPEVMTVAQVAEVLGLTSTRPVLEACASGALRSRRLWGRHPNVFKSALIEFVTGCSLSSLSPSAKEQTA